MIGNEMPGLWLNQKLYLKAYGAGLEAAITVFLESSNVSDFKAVTI